MTDVKAAAEASSTELEQNASGETRVSPRDTLTARRPRRVRTLDPEELRRALDEGARLEGEGDLDRAWNYYRAQLKRYDWEPVLLLPLARVAAARGMLVQAASWLVKARRHGAPPADVESLETSIAAEQGRRADRVLEGGSVEQKLKMARVAWSVGDRALTEQAARAVIAVDPANIEAIKRIAWCRYKDEDLAAAARGFVRLSELDPENPRWPAERSHMLIEMDDPAGAIEAVRAALDRGCSSIKLFRHVPVTALPGDLAAAAARSARALDADAPLASRAIAFSVLTQLDQDLPEGIAPSYYRSDLVPDDADLLRSVVKDDGGEILSAPMEEPAPLALIFTGLADQASMPLFVFDRCLAALGVSALYLRDKQRFGFLRGLRSVGAGRDETIARLSAMIGEVAPTRLLTIGASVGGHAAVCYGAELRADAIIGFSAVTNGSPAFLVDDGRGRIFASKFRAIPLELLDSRVALEAAARPVPVHLVYGSGNWRDARHARHLAPVEGVVLHPLEGFKAHGTILALAGGGDLMPFLRRVALPEAPGAGAVDSAG